MYYIIYPILYVISLLPLRVLYFVSDCFYALVYYIIGYRKKVVMENLQIAFPEKSEQEKIRIAKDFYHNFIDSMIETVKVLSARPAYFEKRFEGNWDIVDQFYDSGRAVQLHLGHTFNWEWGNIVLQKNTRYQVLGVYMPIENKAFDKLFRKIRTKSGSKLLSARNMAAEFLPYRGTRYCLGLVADQSPGKLRKAQWFDFFNRRTAFTIGPAKNAIRNDTVIVFAYIEKRKRGYYKTTLSLVEDNPQSTTEEALTQQFVTYLEGVIREHPSMWLWSHRRWKKQWKGE